MKKYEEPRMSVTMLQNDDVVVTYCIAGNSGGYDSETGKPCGSGTDWGSGTEWGDPTTPDLLPSLNN